jgi:hypothetical protein
MTSNKLKNQLKTLTARVDGLTDFDKYRPVKIQMTGRQYKITKMIAAILTALQLA